MKTNLATFDRTVDAEFLTSFLRLKGVEAGVQDERRLQRYWFHAPPLAGIHVLVPANQMEQANHLVEDEGGGYLLRKAVHCPFCHSARVQYPAMTRKNILPAIAAQLLVAVGIMKHEYYCEDCHFTWDQCVEE